jgi:hypothetical protein
VRIAYFSDVHGNLHALDATLAGALVRRREERVEESHLVEHFHKVGELAALH